MIAPWIDSHAHLGDPAFADDRDAVIARVRDAGGLGVVCIGESLDSAARAKAIAEAHPGFVWWTAGVHPHDAAGFDPMRDGEAISAALEQGAVAVGECGLDFYYDHSARDVQREVFARHIELAHRARLPLVIHTRNAWDDTFDVLDAEGMPERTIFHCFTGSVDEARSCVDRGAYLSFSGIVTFGNAEDIREAARWCPRDRIVVETDAPWLAPVPHRGRKNEPAHVAVIGEFLAAQRGESIDEFAAVTCANAAAAFPGIAR